MSDCGLKTPFDAAIASCYVPDLEAADRFYVELLRLEMVLDQGGCRISRVEIQRLDDPDWAAPSGGDQPLRA